MGLHISEKKNNPGLERIKKGYNILRGNYIFSGLLFDYRITIVKNNRLGKGCGAVSDSKGHIMLNEDTDLNPQEWAYTIAHCMLHNVFGHFDAEKMPGYEKEDENGKKKHIVSCNLDIWNIACDICITKFLTDIKLGRPTCNTAGLDKYGNDADEHKIYERLIHENTEDLSFIYGTATPGIRDMRGLENPIYYEQNKNYNEFSAAFSCALGNSVRHVVRKVGGNRNDTKSNPASVQAEWFMNHFPLLGALASAFEIVFSVTECEKLGIDVAAVDVSCSKIYVNPNARLRGSEMRFVLAHEFLHAGLGHYERMKGRDPFLWNVACDFVINGWLKEMQIGEMPDKGGLYDEQFEGCSSEEVYDRIVSDLKKYSNLTGFRGTGKGDVIGGIPSFGDKGDISLDDFYRSALQNGLEYHESTGRGLIPAGLAQEIRALAMPPIPWHAKLADWFDINFRPIDKKRTYARPSRRQGSTPDIPRPRCVPADIPEYSRTFGVVIDTSGSMSPTLIGYALGAIASYSAAKDVPYARVIFCDANAYDAGYMSPEDISGRVEVIGRGGTILQPGVDMLQNAKDFPKDAPILIITDADIEDDLKVKREHAFLIPQGKRLPFKAGGEVFYFGE